MHQEQTKKCQKKAENKFLVRASGENSGDQKSAQNFCRPNRSAASASAVTTPPLDCSASVPGAWSAADCAAALRDRFFCYATPAGVTSPLDKQSGARPYPVAVFRHPRISLIREVVIGVRYAG